MKSSKVITVLIVSAVTMFMVASFFLHKSSVQLRSNKQKIALQQQSLGCADCDKKDSTQQLESLTSGLSPEMADRIRNIELDLSTREKTTLNDALYLHESITAIDDTFVQRWALAFASERLMRNAYSDDAKGTLEACIIDSFESPNWRIRRLAIATAEESGLSIHNQTAISKIKLLRDDSNPEVSARAMNTVLPGE